MKIVRKSFCVDTVGVLPKHFPATCYESRANYGRYGAAACFQTSNVSLVKSEHPA